jgi:hypothetical protein
LPCSGHNSAGKQGPSPVQSEPFSGHQPQTTDGTDTPPRFTEGPTGTRPGADHAQSPHPRVPMTQPHPAPTHPHPETSQPESPLHHSRATARSHTHTHTHTVKGRLPAGSITGSLTPRHGVCPPSTRKVNKGKHIRPILPTLAKHLQRSPSPEILGEMTSVIS